MGRLFIGFALPEKLQRRLGEECDRLRLSGTRVKWVQPELMHLTLRFIGEVADRDLPEVHEVVSDESAGTGVLKLVARGLGTFPPGESPRVVWCGVVGETDDETEALAGLQKRLDRRLVEMGFRRARGRFRPHVTLGRIRDPRNAGDLLERMGPGVRREFGHFQVPEITLFESRLRPTGPEYVALEQAPLA